MQWKASYITTNEKGFIYYYVEGVNGDKWWFNGEQVSENEQGVNNGRLYK